LTDLKSQVKYKFEFRFNVVHSVGEVKPKLALHHDSAAMYHKRYITKFLYPFTINLQKILEM